MNACLKSISDLPIVLFWLALCGGRVDFFLAISRVGPMFHYPRQGVMNHQTEQDTAGDILELKAQNSWYKNVPYLLHYHCLLTLSHPKCRRGFNSLTRPGCSATEGAPILRNKE